MIRGKNILLLMDSHLEGNFSAEEATVVFELASRCLQYEPRERPNTKDLVSTLAPLQNKPDVSSWFFLIVFSSILNIYQLKRRNHDYYLVFFFSINLK